MNKQHLYIGVALVIIPFLGIYDFLKTFFVICIGIYFIVISRDYSFVFTKKKKVEKENDLVLPVQSTVRPAVQQPLVSTTTIVETQSNHRPEPFKKPEPTTDGVRVRRVRTKKEPADNVTN
jgi:hypothetical protein